MSPIWSSSPATRAELAIYYATPSRRMLLEPNSSAGRSLETQAGGRRTVVTFGKF